MIPRMTPTAPPNAPPSPPPEYANSTMIRTKTVVWNVASDHVTSFIGLPMRQPDREGEDHRERGSGRAVEISQRVDRSGGDRSGRRADSRDGKRARERKHDEREDRPKFEQKRHAPVGRRPKETGAECGEVADPGHRQH